MGRYRTSVSIAEVVAVGLDDWCAARDVTPSAAVASCLERWRDAPGPAATAPGPRRRVQVRVDEDLMADVRDLAGTHVVGLGAVLDSGLARMMAQPVVYDPRA